MAQWTAHQTSNLGVAGSSPAWGSFSFSALLYVRLVARRRYGATVARGIPDPKVGGSNPSSVKHLFCLRSLAQFGTSARSLVR